MDEVNGRTDSATESTLPRTPQRALSRSVTTPPPGPGFIGTGHTAVRVLDPADFAQQDPFIVLMDDRLELPVGSEAGQAHPHAGLETVTFVLEGELHDADEGIVRAGDLQWMTAGSGVIHAENVVVHGVTRILQLWITLPPSARWTPPRMQTVYRANAPVRREPGVEVRVYSGRSGNAIATTQNHVPVTVADIRLDAGATLVQALPATYNGFVYVLEGSARVGGADAGIDIGQVGWLDRSSVEGPSELTLTSGPLGARLMLYAGQPQGVPLVTHGPFVGGSREDLMRASRDYAAGRFPRVSTLVRDVRAQSLTR